mmetsp:Transcript_45103/g.118274  ORF Transcript_45103/g.118274 Transcript_45103/m.118274 type:complete len:406 (-) Transcript_45103:439-1656(-)
MTHADYNAGGLRRQETFRTAMRQNAAEYDEADDIDPDNVGLNFSDFCTLVRERELGEHTTEELRERFRSIDITGSGRVEKHEYLRFSLRDALARSVSRICEIFGAWDEDGNGMVDEREFRRAVWSLGFSDVPQKHINAVFREFDEDRSGEISRQEIERRLRKYAGVIVEQQHDLRRLDDQVRAQKGAALHSSVKLDRGSGRAVTDMLRDALAKNMVRIIDLFRDWDEDANGLIDKVEFFKGIVALGVDAAREEASDLFDTFDIDKGGFIEYKELNKLLRQRVKSKRLRRVSSEPTSLKVGVMPPGASRSSLLSSLTSSKTHSALPTKLMPLGQGTQSMESIRSTIRENPFAYTATYAPQRMQLNLVAQHWWKPLHGQAWRHTRQLPPLRKTLVQTAPLLEDAFGY